jgi:acetolactate synthase-1/2/3 large subunit
LGPSTVGPGATNLATGVGAAWLDGAPTLAITCNVPTPWLDRRIQMRIDHHALFRPLTKTTIPLRPENVGQAIRDAIAIAQAEVPGPVHLDLPEDVASAPAVDSAGSPREAAHLDAIADDARAAVSEALRAARRPFGRCGNDRFRTRCRWCARSVVA